MAPVGWRQATRRALLMAAPRSWVLANGPASAGGVCLTFDDGPDPVGTPAVLAALREGGARGTFFLQGSHAAAHPSLVKRIHEEGHEIGHHSWSHSAPSGTSASALAFETIRTRELLRSTIGVDSHIFRPPHGKLTPGKMFKLVGMKQTIVLWTADPGDGFQASAESLVQWFVQCTPRAGDIVLLHDTTPALGEALPEIIRIVRRQGLGFATVSDWLPAREGMRDRPSLTA